MKNTFQNTLMLLISLVILGVISVIILKPNINNDHHTDYLDAFSSL